MRDQAQHGGNENGGQERDDAAVIGSHAAPNNADARNLTAYEGCA
jgi:hypothetical protein